MPLVFFLAAFLPDFSPVASGGERVAALSEDFLRVALVLASPTSVPGGKILAVLDGSSEPVRDFFRIGGRVRD